MVQRGRDLDPALAEGVASVGVTAGASAPEVLVQRVVERLTGGTPGATRQLDGVEENVTFALPKELQG